MAMMILHLIDIQLLEHFASRRRYHIARAIGARKRHTTKAKCDQRKIDPAAAAAALLRAQG